MAGSNTGRKRVGSDHAPASGGAQSKPNSIFRSYYYLTKPGIVYSNVMTGLAGYLFASDWHIKWSILLALVFGMALVIASACVFNNFLDRGIDAKMARTQKRALVTGQIKARYALAYASVMAVIGFVLLTRINKITVIVGVIAIVGYVLIYGYFKRRSIYGTLVGTVPGGASLVAGYTSFSGHIDFTAVLLFLIMLTWQMAHFYSIALYRSKDYEAAGLPVWPLKRGEASTMSEINRYVYLFILLNLALVLFVTHKFVFLMAMGVVGFYWLKLVKERPRPDVTTWAKRAFRFSLVVICVFSLALSVGARLP